ncbi:hypothetical protein GGF37_004650 [Kickxella alabastrina]|nr:hypothetical protein GGF37_004650 [Kickxella alabastrina]
MSGSETKQDIYGCRCLNVRVHVESTADERTSLENIQNVLQCTLGGLSAVEVGLNALVEVKPGSSVDRSIKVLRCLLCKSPVLYFKSENTRRISQQQMPEPHSEAFLDKEATDPTRGSQIKALPDYSGPFGVLLLSEFTSSSGGARATRLSTHIPREIQQKAAEYLQRQEEAKNERVREYIRAQDHALEQLKARTMDECAKLSDIINAAHPQPSATASTQNEPAALSGLAAMLRGGGGGGGALGRNPIMRTSPLDRRRGNSDDEYASDEADASGLYGLVDVVEPAGSLSARGMARRRRFGSHQSEEQSDDEESFGNFAQQPAGQRFSPVRMAPSQQQQQQRTGNLGQMLAGSVPIQIPTMTSGSLIGGRSLSRREFQQRVEEGERDRRREQIARELPRTFVPPHQLLDQIHENDADLFIGSKPRDSYGFGRRYAPG